MTWRLTALWPLLLALAACAGTPTLRAHVESFSTLTASPAPAKVAIVPFTGIDGGSLEYRNYRDRLAGRLEASGFEVVPVEAAPPWRMELGFRVGDGRSVVRSHPFPPSRRLRTGHHRPHPFADPFFHGHGYGRTVTYTVYGRHLVLVLVDAAADEEVWRASVINHGRQPTLAPAFDGLVTAAIATFPEGGRRTLSVALDPEG